MKNFKLSRKLLMGATIACALSISFTSCSDDDDDDDVPVIIDNGNVQISSDISSDATWTKNNVYQLLGRIQVLDGATLTIEAGTVIKGDAGTGTSATALIVARGGKLMATGTAAEPIIFTSVADNIESGQIASPNLDPDQNGLWGGLIILGKAPIYASAAELAIEGIPTSENALYGGSDVADNSGTINYISIRHGGSNIGANNEINGLTLGGVGSGTTISNVEIIGNQDDGVEWFGGTVSVSNVLVWNVGDDALDTDQGWSGTLDNFIVITPTGHCFELDGPESGQVENQVHTFNNGTIVASDTTNEIVSEDLINVDNNSEVNLNNIFIKGIANGQQVNKVTSPLVTFTNIVFDVPAANLANYVNGIVPAGITAGSSSANKADATVFDNWTWAATAGTTVGL